MKPTPDLITAVLLHPDKVLQLSMIEWDLLVRQGRASNLLANLCYRLETAGFLSQVPLPPRNHIVSAYKMAQRQDSAIQWESVCIAKELADADTKITVLKGAAYVLAGLNAARGRLFTDVDILVPKTSIEGTERELMIHGWHGGHHDEYDQRYFRKWMHEIPPLQHRRRGTTIDVHHTILPESARVKVNTPALFENLVQVKGHVNVYVLPPHDMLLHSATHLFHEGNFEKGLRDLFDLDALLREFGAENGFWDGLVPRAVNLGLTRPLYYALRYTSTMLGTPVPAHVVQAALVGRPPAFVAKIMDICYLRALRPMHPSTASFGNWAARFALYVRSHWIRMPVHLLAYHLGRKAFIRPKRPDDEVVIDQATAVVTKGGDKL